MFSSGRKAGKDGTATGTGPVNKRKGGKRAGAVPEGAEDTEKACQAPARPAGYTTILFYNLARPIYCSPSKILTGK
jgi:hypothetical protein